MEPYLHFPMYSRRAQETTLLH